MAYVVLCIPFLVLDAYNNKILVNCSYVWYNYAAESMTTMIVLYKCNILYAITCGRPIHVVEKDVVTSKYMWIRLHFSGFFPSRLITQLIYTSFFFCKLMHISHLT